MLAPGADPGALDPWTVVPSAPFVAVAVVTGFLVLAATGRPGHRLGLPPRLAVDGAILVVVAAVLGDLVMLSVTAASPPADPSPLVACAISASAIRLLLCGPQLVSGLRSRRPLDDR